MISVSTKPAAPMTTLTPICSTTRLSGHRIRHQLNFPVFNFIILKQKRLSRSSITIGSAASASNQNQNNSPGLYSAQTFDLTAPNVDLVLEDVRPYLISDGGNVEVVSVEDGVISLRLQGACESCPSSTTTMKMGIERVLKEKFGDAVKDILQVYDHQPTDTTVQVSSGQFAVPAVLSYYVRLLVFGWISCCEKLIVSIIHYIICKFGYDVIME